MVMLQRVDSSLPLQAAISTVVKYNADYPSCRMRLQTKYIDNYPIVLTGKTNPVCFASDHDACRSGLQWLITIFLPECCVRD